MDVTRLEIRRVPKAISAPYRKSMSELEDAGDGRLGVQGGINDRLLAHDDYLSKNACQLQAANGCMKRDPWNTWEKSRGLPGTELHSVITFN
jgi:hypothetical protein